MDIEIKHKHPLVRKYLPAAVVTVVIVTIIAATAAALINSGTSSYRAEGNGLLTGEVTEGKFSDYVRLGGRVETGTVVQVSALEGGIVVSRLAEEGSMVKEGDVILTLHNPNLRQQILDSESQLAEKQNMLRDTEIAMEKERLQIKQELLTAQTDVNRRRRAADQTTRLYNENLISREEYLKAREDYELSSQNLSLLRERLRQDSSYRSVQLAMMRESLGNMQQNLMLVRSRADNLNVRASHSGQLGSLNAELGQSISSGQQVGQINILNDYKISVSVDEHYIDRVAPGIEGSFSRGGKTYAVEVRKVYPEVDKGQFRADLSIKGELPANIRVGQTYTVELQLGEPSQAVMVPRGSFFQSSGGRWVYVLSDDGKTAEKRNVRLGRQNPRFYEVEGGLAPGEKIIISSYADFGDTDKVVIKHE